MVPPAAAQPTCRHLLSSSGKNARHCRNRARNKCGNSRTTALATRDAVHVAALLHSAGRCAHLSRSAIVLRRFFARFSLTGQPFWGLLRSKRGVCRHSNSQPQSSPQSQPGPRTVTDGQSRTEAQSSGQPSTARRPAGPGGARPPTPTHRNFNDDILVAIM